MSLHDEYDAGHEDEVGDFEFSGSENEAGFDEDMEALKKACLRTGTDLNDLEISSADDDRPSTSGAAAAASAASTDSGSEDDLEIFRSIRNRLALSDDFCGPLSFEPLCTLPPDSSDENAEDDFETLRAIQKRFVAYSADDTWKNSREDDMVKAERMTNISLEDAMGNDSCERVQDYVQAGNISHVSGDNVQMQPVGLVQWDQSDANELSTCNSSRFPKSAQLLFDAIKKNRSYQKFLRSKLTQIEVKIEENKKLKERVKILRDFQVSCKKITGRALSTKKDPRIQLISTRKSRTSKDPEVNDKKFIADYGPPENSTVASYRTVLMEFPLRLQRKKWSREEKENIEKGIRQQFQERALQVSVDWLSASDGSHQDGNNLDGIIATINDLEITPERIREFLPKVNWDQLASFYVKGRSGAECETRWLNHEDPLINRNSWTAEEDKNLLFVAQEMGIGNWLDIAVSLGTNRTPFQCLARYQRSLNACILKREWTKEEDDQLRIAVEVFGECDWQSVASTLKGRTGTQCSNRWKKSLHPTRQRVGRWTQDEDKRLKVAVMLFGPKNWRKIAEVVPGRTQVQCRERWVNSLDPALNLGTWTEEEDSRLEAGIEEHGYCWSKVATCIPSRTDNQCWRRWKMLHPEEVPLLREARKIRKATLITNFVDRESERPALGLNDFNVQLPMITATSEPENTNLPSKEKRKQRGRRLDPGKENAAALRLSPEKRSRKSCRKGVQACSVEVSRITGENEAKTAIGRNSVRKKLRDPPSENNNFTEPSQDVTFQKKRKREPPSGNNSCTELAQHVPIQKKRRKSPSGHANCEDQVQDEGVQTEKRKQQPESSKCIESMQDISWSRPLSTLCMATNHEAESFASCRSIKRKKSKASSKQCSKNAEIHEEQHSICSENSVLSGVGDDGAEVMQNSGVDDASRKKSTAKPRSKRKTCMNSSTSQSSGIIVAECFENLPLSKNTKKRGTKHSKSRKSNEPSADVDGDDQTLACLATKNTKKRGTRQSKSRKSNEPSADVDGDDQTLACLATNNTKKRGTRQSKSRKSNNPSGDEHGDDQTLACFIRNKSKKIKHEIAENAHLSTSEGMDERSRIDQTQFGLRHCDVENPENSLLHRSLKETNMPNGKDTTVVDVVDETVVPHDVVRESSELIEEDMITLACLQERLKKMRATIAQSEKPWRHVRNQAVKGRK